MVRFNNYFLLLVSTLFLIKNSFSQSNWINSAGGLTHDEALDVCHDQNGNYYVTGYFTNAANFGNLSITGFGFSDIFIAKYNAAGQPQWVKNAGGSGPDRGYSIYCDQAGNLFVTGYFSGPATFETTTLNSSGNTQDVFIAKYDTNGNLQWVTSVGGNMGDTGYGITSDDNGNVIVTGQYKGTATFGTTTFTSMIDPNTMQPSFDIFIVKYDANGNFLWAQNGAAEYDDRGLDLATDDANNIFVVGQYSDTITFDFTYNNQVMNAGFVLKLDQNGQQQLFQSMSGVQTLVYSVAIDNNNDVFITGDFRGTLAIVGSPSTYVSANYYNKVFITKFDNALNVLWAEADASDNEVTSKSIDLDNNGDPYITGLFKCRFNEYSDLFGDAIFYSAGYRDVFITKYSSAGVRQWMRHFGGPKDDYCSGIAVYATDQPFIAGGYENYFNVPKGNSFITFPANDLNYSVQPAGLCGDTEYPKYYTITSAGQKDIFLARPVDLNREYYDYFVHSDYSNCVRDTVPVCIESCMDTVEYCGDKILTPYFFNASPGRMGPDMNYINAVIGPEYDILWSTGSIVDTAWARHTGYYWATISRKDGCMSHTDSVYFIEHEFPPAALISDDEGININHPPTAIEIELCFPDTVQLTASNVFPADTFYWTGPAFQTVNDSVINVYTSGDYFIYTETDFGCARYNRVEVILFNPPGDSLELSTFLTDSLFEATDTVTVCEDGYYEIAIHDTVSPVTHSQIIQSTGVNWYLTGPTGMVDSTFTDHHLIIHPTVSGWYTMSDTLMKICGDTIKYYSSRTYYVNILPKPPISITTNHNGSLICPGDTAWATVNVNPSDATIAWSGVGIIENYTDSVRVIVTSNNQQLHVTAVYTDTITGCSNDTYSNIYFSTIPPPIITMNPVDGIICPYDSILLTAPNAVFWQWVGPTGNFIGNTQQIYVDVPGFYHCIIEDFTGCIQTSNFLELKEYNTPYLDVFPSDHICANGNTTLTVIASSSALIQWQPPLSGNSPTQIVSSPGTYVCEITLCGITTVDSVTVIQSNTPANIYANDSVICPGDTLILYANGGMMDYLWNPGGSHDNFIYVTQPGNYTVTTTDGYGCLGNSDPFTVYAAPQPPAPVVSDTLICAGQSIILNASASNTVLWYTSAISANPVYSGNNFTTPIITNNTSYFVQTYDSICGSVRDEVMINVYQSSTTPQISGDTILCVGESVNLSSNNVPGADYFWTGPNGLTSSTSNLFYQPVDSTYSGVYTLYYSDTSCTSPVVNVNVVVNEIPQPDIQPGSTIYLCVGQTVVLTETIGYSSYLWSPGNQTGNSITVTTPGTYYVTVTENGCSGVSNTVIVSGANPVLDPIANDITVCAGNTGTLVAFASGTITWYDENYNLVGTGSNYTTSVMDTTTVFYVLNTASSGCESNYVEVWVNVPDLDSAPVITYAQPVCEGGDLNLFTSMVSGAMYNWSGPDNFSSSLQNPVITNVTQNNAGIYSLVITLNGCSSYPGNETVVINPNPVAPQITGDHVYCQQDSVIVESVIDPQLTASWYSPSLNYSGTDSVFIFPATLNENGLIMLVVEDANGCVDTSVYNIVVNPIPYGALYASRDICSGEDFFIVASSNYTNYVIWTGPSGFNSTGTTISVTNAQTINSGYYVAEFTLNNCSFTDSVYVTVSDYPNIDLGPDTALCSGGQILFSLNPAYDYYWFDGSSSNEYLALDSGLIYVTASIYPGCMTTDSVYVELWECTSMFSNVFTPNGDGMNDVFRLEHNEGAQSYEVDIYDRWGRVIYHINETHAEWRGTDMQLNDLPEGVYYWIAHVVNYFGNTETYRGYVHLYR